MGSVVPREATVAAKLREAGAVRFFTLELAGI